MVTYLEAIKPDAAHNDARAAYATGFYPVLRMGKKVLWSGGATYKRRDFGEDAKRMATDEAEMVLRCDPGSLMAKQLQRAVDTGEPIDG